MWEQAQYPHFDTLSFRRMVRCIGIIERRMQVGPCWHFGGVIALPHQDLVLGHAGVVVPLVLRIVTGVVDFYATAGLSAGDFADQNAAEARARNGVPVRNGQW